MYLCVCVCVWEKWDISPQIVSKMLFAFNFNCIKANKTNNWKCISVSTKYEENLACDDSPHVAWQHAVTESIFSEYILLANLTLFFEVLTFKEKNVKCDHGPQNVLKVKF